MEHRGGALYNHGGQVILGIRVKRKLLSILASILAVFPGRRAYLPMMAATSVLGLVLFLIFPPAAPMTGGGALLIHNARAAHGPVNTADRAKIPRNHYLTLNPGDTVDLSPGPVSFGKHPELLSRLGMTSRYRARVSGHTVLTIGKGRARHQVYLFVSPLPSRQVSRDDVDWYKTQYGTGYANCGPAVVSMAVLWARGQDIPVQDIREEIGYPYDDGAVSFDNLSAALGLHKVPFTTPQLAGPADLRGIVDRGHIAVVLIQTGDIDKVEGDPVTDLVGRYYDDDEGHYVLVKGYTLDRGYFVVYDPYPVDWESNSLRYGDDVSMIGKNRYYPAEQLFSALKTPVILEVSSY
jgi:hypothetical protein